MRKSSSESGEISSPLLVALSSFLFFTSSIWLPNNSFSVSQATGSQRFAYVFVFHSRVHSFSFFFNSLSLSLSIFCFYLYFFEKQIQ